MAVPVIRRRRSHRVVFCAAGIYNLAWGLHAAIDPGALFRFAGMPAARYPELWACLGMVIGLYGLIYFEIARRPETCFVPAAVGLLGKVLGPVGWLVLVLDGDWPVATAVLILANDVVWWYPFGRYLRDSWPLFRRDLTGSPVADRAAVAVAVTPYAGASHRQPGTPRR